MQPLDKTFRNRLARTIKEAPDIAGDAACAQSPSLTQDGMLGRAPSQLGNRTFRLCANRLPP